MNTWYVMEKFARETQDNRLRQAAADQELRRARGSGHHRGLVESITVVAVRLSKLLLPRRRRSGAGLPRWR